MPPNPGDGGDTEAVMASAARTASGGQATWPWKKRRGAVVAADAADAPAATPTATATPKQPPKKHPLLANLLANAKRPDVVTVKTLPPKWRALQSRWRFLHALFFYVGWPAHVLARVWPPLLLNMSLAFLIAADHIVRARTQRALLPDLNGDVVRSLDPLTRYLMFSVSLLLALRLNRVYDRWFLARTSFSQIGSSALALCQRFESFYTGPDRDKVLEDVCRWAIVWHYSVLQICVGAKRIDPLGARWLHADELDAYSKARKGRQLVNLKLVQLIASADFSPPALLTVEGALQRGVSAQGVCTTIRNQAMPYSLTLLSTGFVEVFLLMLPLSSLGAAQMVDSMGNAKEAPHQRDEAVFTAVIVLLIYFFINLLFLGADEVGVQLENPFDWFPAADIVRSTARDCVRMFGEARELRGLPGGSGGGADAKGEEEQKTSSNSSSKSWVRGSPWPLEALVPPG